MASKESIGFGLMNISNRRRIRRAIGRSNKIVLLKTRAQPTATANQHHFEPSFRRITSMAALVVHASKDRMSTRTLYLSPAIAVAKARVMSKAGWQVHIVDADGRIFHCEQFDEILRFDPKRTSSSRDRLFDR
jgi:hypothetical protein